MSRCGSCGTVSGMFDAGDDFVDGGEEEAKKVQMCTFVVQWYFVTKIVLTYCEKTLF